MIIARENQQLGAFRLLRLIGKGGMGEVWLAEDTRLLRTVAVKILPPEVASDAEARARLIREAQMAAQLNHPSIATVHAIEEQNGALFIAMEYIEGQPFGAAIRSRELSDYDIVRIARDVADALAEAHARGIIHRDIKPDNVMVSGKRVKVLDFGIAKQIGSEVRAGDFRTEAGMVVGTIEYMSPEQALGRPLDARTDLFSLGVVLYQALSGALPFSGSTATELLLRVCRDAPQPLASVRPDLPNELAAVISRCLEKDRDRRFASAGELAEALERVLPRLSRLALPATPTMVISAAAEEREAAEPKIVASPYAGKRILIADDDAAIRRLFETLAKRERIDCDVAGNGSEAVAALKQREYSLMFLDIMMPRIDGWGVLDYLRTRQKGRVPSLFIITAFLDQTVSAADREIVSGIIYKPVDADDIAALMRQCARGGSPAGVLQRTRHRLIAAAG
ncbi:MAG TPA: serine/threonine-protein kinase [Thermoanaerobaculia bacterium]|nr:serine/threonine-protein kinase [Thermoanaerobaculia bacterium]